MILKTVNNQYAFEAKNICTLFFPYEKIKDDGNEDITVSVEISADELIVFAKDCEKQINKSKRVLQNEDMAYAVSVLLYDALSELTGIKLPWGILYGVRPAKLMHRYANKFGEDKAKEYFVNHYLTTPEKAELASEVMKHENRIISLSQDNSYSLYVSIPFCPTRCSYCSFVSHSIERTKKLVEPYVDLLCKELEKTAKVASRLGLRLETIYFGGGTPTSLSASQLDRLLSTIENSFDLTHLREYTVEAGRPDTVDEEKLLTLKAHNVGRISINPQSFNDDVLAAIGRQHTSKQTLDAFSLARKCGFDNINTDLIAGLPKDNFASFKNSVDTAIKLGATSVTIHTLALKSASYIVTGENKTIPPDRKTAADMVAYSNSALSKAGYYPYYMYRQSKSVGNLENVGWCREGYDCLYNVFMMDETHSVFACGAGAVTRLKNPKTNHIDRIYNYKYPYEYIDNFNTILDRKEEIVNFY